MLKLIPAKSIATLTVVSLLFSIALPLSAFAATEVRISGNGNATVTINGQTIQQSNTTTVTEVEVPTEPEPNNSTDSGKTASILEDEEPTATPTPTERLKRRRTPTPTPTATPTKTPTPTLTIATSSTTDEKKTFIMNAINDYRRSQGLSAVKTDKFTCDFAKTRAQEITKGFNHDGFRNRINNNSLPYPSYTRVTENIAITSDYKKVVSMWIKSSGHAENMRRDTPYVCVESSGNYYAYEGWKP